MKNPQRLLLFSVFSPLLVATIQVAHDFDLETDFGVEFNK